MCLRAAPSQVQRRISWPGAWLEGVWRDVLGPILMKEGGGVDGVGFGRRLVGVGSGAGEGVERDIVCRWWVDVFVGKLLSMLPKHERSRWFIYFSEFDMHDCGG